MRKQDEFKELVRFSDSLEAEFLIGLLKYGDVKCKTMKRAQMTGPFYTSSQASFIIQVLQSDLERAEALLAEYRKTQGVPFS